jgi:hypothetical protein
VTLHVSLVGTGADPLLVAPMGGHPDTAVIRIGPDFTLHVRVADIDRLSAALNQARAVLSGTGATPNPKE